MIAKQRDANFGVIFGINLLFGWTVLGWIAALIRAIIEPPRIKKGYKPMVGAKRHRSWLPALVKTMV